MGRPRPRFMVAPTADAGVYYPTAAADGIGVALSCRIRLPSGPYLLGLPRFFATLTAGQGPPRAATPTRRSRYLLSAIASAAATVASGGGAAAKGTASALASPDAASMPAAPPARAGLLRAPLLGFPPRGIAIGAHAHCPHLLHHHHLSQKKEIPHPKSPENPPKKKPRRKNQSQLDARKGKKLGEGGGGTKTGKGADANHPIKKTTNRLGYYRGTLN
jgi:hypothetical protein